MGACISPTEKQIMHTSDREQSREAVYPEYRVKRQSGIKVQCKPIELQSVCASHVKKEAGRGDRKPSNVASAIRALEAGIVVGGQPAPPNKG